MDREGPIDEASAASAVSALQAELELADGNLDALDRKAALLPAFLAALAGLFLSPGVTYSGLGLVAAVVALLAGILSVSGALYAMRARAHTTGPDADVLVANLHLSVSDFHAALAHSLAEAINNVTAVAVFKATWLNRAMVLAVLAILCLSVGRLFGTTT